MVYFAYKEGVAQGSVYWNGGAIQWVNFNVLHNPIADYLYFSAGSANTYNNEYENFNGQLS
jgi:hypothetical protein